MGADRRPPAGRGAFEIEGEAAFRARKRNLALIAGRGKKPVIGPRAPDPPVGHPVPAVGLPAEGG
jgi:hypothetical protein